MWLIVQVQDMFTNAKANEEYNSKLECILNVHFGNKYKKIVVKALFIALKNQLFH